MAEVFETRWDEVGDLHPKLSLDDERKEKDRLEKEKRILRGNEKREYEVSRVASEKQRLSGEMSDEDREFVGLLNALRDKVYETQPRPGDRKVYEDLFEKLEQNRGLEVGTASLVR